MELTKDYAADNVDGDDAEHAVDESDCVSTYQEGSHSVEADDENVKFTVSGTISPASGSPTVHLDMDFTESDLWNDGGTDDETSSDWVDDVDWNHHDGMSTTADPVTGAFTFPTVLVEDGPDH